MATPTTAKQDWLVARGKPKSYSYFMTGPNLGPDWDWDKAVAGGYSTFEENQFIASGEVKYKAHKAKSKTKAPASGNGAVVSGSSTACAKTASKAIHSAVYLAAQNANDYYEKAVVPFLNNQIATPLESATWRKTMTNQFVDVVAEVGEQADEAIAMKAMLRLMDDMDATRRALQAEQAVNLALAVEGVDTPALRHALVELDRSVSKVSAAYGPMQVQKPSNAAKLFETLWAGDAEDELTKIANLAATETIKSQRRGIGYVLQQVSDDLQTDDFALWEELFNVAPDVVGDAEALYGAMQVRAQQLGQNFVDELFDADDIIGDLHRLDQLSDLLSQKLGIHFSDVDDRFVEFDAMLGDLAETISSSVSTNATAMEGLQTNYATPEWWTKSAFSQEVGDLADSPVEFWAKTYGQDWENRMDAELEGFGDLIENLADNGAFPPHLAQDAQNALIEVFDDVGSPKGTFSMVVDDIPDLLPGPTPTAETVIDALDEGFVAKVKAAGTDELNPLVQDKLEATGEAKTLTYFMTKKQKQDFLLMHPSDFAAEFYDIPYKGQVLSGQGLGTVKAKYALKNGKQAGKASVAGQSIDDLTPQTFDPPANAPAWFTDAITDKQLATIKGQLSSNHSFEVAWFGAQDPGAPFPLGKMTKKQASLLLDDLLDNPGKSWTTADIHKALNYGDDVLPVPPTAKTYADDVIDLKQAHAAAIADAEEVIEDIADTMVEQAPAVAGAVQDKSTAAAVSVDWDAPHQFDYVGDGKRKWGGAHRKWHFRDEAGDDWMLKHGVAEFRHEGETAAHRIGHLAGFDVPEARVTTQTVEGKRIKGFMQRMFRRQDIKGEIGDSMRGGSLVGLDDDVVRQLQEHQVLTWLIGDHDGHSGNFLILKDGRLVGVDKGQAFKFMGNDFLSGDYAPPGNHGEILYNRMWREYAEGKIDLDLDSIAAALTRVEAIDDVQLEGIVRAYAQQRFAAGRSAGALSSTAADNADELVSLVLNRKRFIRQDFTRFYKEQAQRRGVAWTPAWEKAVAVKSRVVTPGQILTPIDEAFVAGLQRAGTAGKAIYVGGADVERAQVLFDIVEDTKGNQALRVHARLRPNADKRVMRLMAEEGGDEIGKVVTSAAADLADDTPALITSLDQATSKMTAGGKTVNHHISTGDFEFNKGSIDGVKALKLHFEAAEPKWKTAGLTTRDSVPTKEINAVVRRLEGRPADVVTLQLETAFNDTAALVVQRKAAKHYAPHIDEIIDQAAKGKAAEKVGFVPEFDAFGEYSKARLAAIEAAKKKLGRVTEQVVDTLEDRKTFTSVSQGPFKTTKTVKGTGVGPDQRVAQLTADVADRMAGGSKVTVTAKTADDVTMYYSPHRGNMATDKGFVEILVRTDGEVGIEDVQRAYDVLAHRIGVSADLADSEAMELTYWRMVQGTYKNSKEAGQVRNPYARAIKAADERVSALGRNPNPQDEIEAIKGAYRAQFGAHVDDADFLPIHGHALAEHLEEIGFGRHVRPELTDADLMALDKYIVKHRITGGATMDRNFYQGAMRDGLHSGSERRRIGYWKPTGDAMSAARDVETGGANGLFMRIAGDSGAPSSGFMMDAKNAPRWLGNSNFPTDRFGNLSKRQQETLLTAEKWGDYVGGTNEIVYRDMVNWVDNADVVFFPSAQEAAAAQRIFREAGLPVLRGVPIEERFVHVANQTRYIKEFKTKYLVGRVSPLRHTAESLRAGPLVRARAATRKAVVQTAERLKIRASKPGLVGPQLGKKISKGRYRSLFVRHTNVGETKSYVTIGARKHTVENAMSLSVEDLFEAGWIDNTHASVIGDFMESLGIKKWAHGADEVFSQVAGSAGGPSVVIDLSVYGVDIKQLSNYQVDRLMREFVQAVNDNNLEAFAAKWAGTVAA